MAALTTALLRRFKIPARLVTGYANKIHHAWVEVKLENKTILYDPTEACIKQKRTVKYTIEKWY